MEVLAKLDHVPGQEIVAAPKKEVMDIAISRAAQEVQAAMVVAKKFPRDENIAFEKIMKACKRKSLAEVAVYEYPRGSEKVSGPSIRLAEVLAQSWGNIDAGVIELDQNPNESKVMAYCWDLETNSRDTKIFTVKHERHTKAGVKKLTDPRDLYEMAANQGSRRKRACILAIIPGDIVDAAVAECDKTLAGENKEPLSDRIRTMVVSFAELGVTSQMIETRFGHSVDSLSENELVKLRRAWNSINDGMGKREDFFDIAPEKQEPGKSRSDQVADLLTPSGGISEEEKKEIIAKEAREAKGRK